MCYQIVSVFATYNKKDISAIVTEALIAECDNGGV